jgi:signal peptidase I/conjugal transfer pilin signal peptidase TrbI
LKKSLSEFIPDRKKLCTYLAAVSALVFGLFLPGRIMVAISPSLDHRIFVITKRFTPEEIRKDDYVVFTIRSHYIKNGKPSRLLKKVSCVAGEKLETSAREYYCDGEYLGMAKWYSLKGEPVDAFVYSGTVPEGKLFVTGHHVDSFDSRYLGFIERSKVEGIARPHSVASLFS